MIYVVATITLADGRRDEFLRHFQAVMPKVHEEPGCLEYLPTVDQPTSIDLQPEERTNVVTVVEKWQDIEALEKHLVAPHMIEYRGKVRELVESVTLSVLRPA